MLRYLLCLGILLYSVDSYAANLNDSVLQENSIFRQGGPDSFGYRFIDNVNEPNGPGYDWVEIARDLGGLGFNTGLSLDDEVVTIQLNGFQFPFYGVLYNQNLTVSSNGFLSFGNAFPAFQNSSLPSSLFSSPMIYVFWDDLYLPESGNVWYFYDVQNSRFIIEWNNIAHQVARLSRFSFQAHLYSNGEIRCMYQQVGAPSNSSTIGIQGGNGGSGTRFLSYAFNGSPTSPTNQLAVRFYRAIGTLQVTLLNESLNPIQNGIVIHRQSNSVPSYSNSIGIASMAMLSGNQSILCCANGYEAWSSTLNIPFNGLLDTTIILTPQVSPPNPVPGVLSYRSVNNLMNVRWQQVQNVPNFYGYFVYRINEINDTTFIAYKSSASDTLLIDNGVLNGFNYRYGIRVCSSGGFSAMVSSQPNFSRLISSYHLLQTATGWIDTGTNWTNVSLFGTGMISQPIEFQFPFYSDRYNSFQISSSGFLIFSPTYQSYPSFQSLLTSAFPNNLIAGAWSDWDIPLDSVKVFNDSLNQRFIVSVLRAYPRDNPNSWISYQFILNSDGTIQLNFRGTSASNRNFAIGVENSDGTLRSYLLPNQLPQQQAFSILIQPIVSSSGVRGTFTSTLGEVIGGMLEVRTHSRTEIPNHSSQFEIRNLPAGQQTLVASSPGFQSISRIVNFIEDSVILSNFQLQTIGNVAPVNVSVDTLFDDRIVLRWSLPPIDEIDVRTGFRIYRNDSLIATLPSNQFQFVDSLGSALENFTISYQVSALYSTAPFESNRSASLNARFNMPPLPPDSLRISAGGASFLLQWNSPTSNVDRSQLTDLQGFYIYQDTILLATVSSNTLQYIVSASDTGRFFEYRVIAFDDVQNNPNRSKPSNSVRANLFGEWRSDFFHWFSLTNALRIPLTSDNSIKVSIGFQFPFYGSLFDSINVSANGFLSFSDYTAFPTESSPFPTSSNPNGLIALLWDDLSCTNGTVKVAQFENLFIVSYENVRHQTSNLLAGSFQVWLYPNGEIYFSYLRAPAEMSYGIGIEDNLGLNGIEIYRNGNGGFVPTDSSAVRIWGLARGNGTFSGTVRQSNGNPISNALVSCNDNWSVTTNQTGVWSLSVPAGKWTLSTSANCFYPLPLVRRNQSILSNQNVVFNDTLYTSSVVSNPTSINLELVTDSLQTTLTLLNNGQTNLDWRASIRYFAVDTTSTNPPATIPDVIHFQVEPTKSEDIDLESNSGFSTDQTWGPDGFGYYAMDSQDSRFPSWMTYRAIHSQEYVRLYGDDITEKIYMNGFLFSYYGNSYDSIRINTNGSLQFHSSHDNYGVRYNTSLPNSNSLNSILPLWDDLETTIYTLFDPFDNVYTILWKGNRYANPTDTVEFQVQLHGNQNAIVFLYRTIRENSVSPTIGLQGGSGVNNYFTQCFYSSIAGANIPNSMDNYGILFIHPNGGMLQNWLRVSPSNGVLNRNQSTLVTLGVAVDTNYTRPSTISANLVLSTNTCANVIFPVTIDLIANTAIETNSTRPMDWKIYSSYPNPFNSSTLIRFDVPKLSNLQIGILDVLGRTTEIVYAGKIDAGYHSIKWNSRNHSSGVYFISFISDDFQATKKILLLK